MTGTSLISAFHGGILPELADRNLFIALTSKETDSERGSEQTIYVPLSTASNVPRARF